MCGARVKTKDTLKQHRKKLHNLTTPIPKTALISEDAIRTVETPGVIIADQRQAGTTGLGVVGVGLSHSEDQRIIGLSSMGNINTVSPLDQRLIGAINVLPKM